VPTVQSDDALRGSLMADRVAPLPLRSRLGLLFAELRLWILAAFVGASMVTSVLAHIFQSDDPMRVETAVLASIGGIALTWFALYRLRVLFRRVSDME